MLGERTVDFNAVFARLGGETIVSGEGSFPTSAANSPIPERQENIVKLERQENIAQVDGEKQPCLKELYPHLSDEDVSQKINKLSAYAVYFECFLGNIDEVSRVSVRSFLGKRTQLGLWYIAMDDLAGPVLSMVNKEVQLFDEEYLVKKKIRLEKELAQEPKAVANKEELEEYIKKLQVQKYCNLLVDAQLDYLFELCQEFISMEKEKYYKEQQQKELADFFKDITTRAMKKYREYNEGVLKRLTSFLFVNSSERFEIPYLNRIEKLIKHCESNDEVLYVLGNYYYAHLNAESIQGKERLLVDNYSFISFFLEELNVIEENTNLKSLLEHKVREQANVDNQVAFVGFKFSFFNDYHVNLREFERIKMVCALMLFDDISIVNKIEHRVKEEEEKFVMVVVPGETGKCFS